MKAPQNVLKMSIVSPDTSREMVTPLTDGYNNNQNSRAFFVQLTASVSVLQDVIKIKCLGVTVLHYLR